MARPDPAALALACVGAALVALSAFLPLRDGPALLVAEGNTFVQAEPLVAGILLVGVVGILGLAYTYHHEGRANLGVLMIGLTLAGGAAALLVTQSFFAIPVPDDPAFPTVDGSPGIAPYVTALGGLTAAVGGWIMRGRTRT